MQFKWTYRAVDHEDVSVARILETWTDPSFYTDLAEELQLEGHDVAIDPAPDRLVVKQQLTFSTAAIPGVFRGLLGVGDSMSVDWTSEFPRDGSPGTMSASAQNGRVAFAPSSSFTHATDGLVWAVEGPVRMKAPWPVRGTAESLLTKLLVDVLTDQATVTQRRLHATRTGGTPAAGQ